MTETAVQIRHLEVTCLDCHYTEVVERDGGRAAELIVEHGRETGHKLTTEAVESAP